ncbi:MAG: ABC transporter permease [Candidatus Obscuribacterales bacterium]|nr:ABC transporter permease [Candidatus Obscuribacterales bacterium]
MPVVKKTPWQRFRESRIGGLITKETLHIVRDKHLVFLLLFPPTIQLFILGASLDIGVRNVPIGFVDYSHSSTSRNLVSAVMATNLFRLSLVAPEESALSNAIKSSKIKVGVVVPRDFEQTLQREHVSHVRVILDGADAYTAKVVRGYLMQTILHFDGGVERPPQPITASIKMLWNPGMASSWYFVPGVIGAMLTLTSTLVSSASLLREKELGTLEQLLMTPYSVGEILLAKVAPVFAFLMLDVVFALAIAFAVFGLPFRGNMLLFFFASSLYIFVGMGLGIMMATACKTERQAHLVSFFVNVPVMQLSGAVVPFETMPAFLQRLAILDPLCYYTVIARSLFLKGTPAPDLILPMLMLAASAVVLFTFSLLRFRRQMG